MASTHASPHPPSASVELEQEEQQQQLPPQPPFTFASPISFSFTSETHEDAIDLGYESWIQQQSKITTRSKRPWMDEEEAEAEAEAINMHHHHQEMMLRVADNLPDEAYELSLRDMTELSLSPPPPPPPPTTRGRAKPMPCRHKTVADGFIIKLFMPSPSKAAAPGSGREKSRSTSSVPRKKSVSVSANNHGGSMENDTYNNGYHMTVLKGNQ